MSSIITASLIVAVESQVRSPKNFELSAMHIDVIDITARARVVDGVFNPQALKRESLRDVLNKVNVVVVKTAALDADILVSRPPHKCTRAHGRKEKILSGHAFLMWDAKSFRQGARCGGTSVHNHHAERMTIRLARRNRVQHTANFCGGNETVCVRAVPPNSVTAAMPQVKEISRTRMVERLP